MERDSSWTDELVVIGKYSDMVYRMAFSLLKHKQDAEDIHQEVFIRYLRKRPALESAEHEKAWFLRVTVNLCRNHWKTAWKQRMVGLGEADFAGTGGAGQEAADGEDLAAVQIKTEQENALIETVGRLPQKYRAVIHLFYYEDLSVSEIAAILGRKPSTVRTQLTRARDRLKEMLKEG